MNVIVLCAGFGTRLLPLTKNTPKALLEVAGRPVLDFLMPQLLELPEVGSVHLVANGRFFGQFYAWHERWRARMEERGISLVLHTDGSMDDTGRLGAVGDLAFVLRSLGAEAPVLVTAGDTIYRFPLAEALAGYEPGGPSRVLALPEPSRQVRQRLPVLDLSPEGRVERVHEPSENPTSAWVLPDLYVLQPEALRLVGPFLTEGGSADSLARFIDHVAARVPVEAMRLTSSRAWLDIGTRYMYQRATEMLRAEPLMT